MVTDFEEHTPLLQPVMLAFGGVVLLVRYLQRSRANGDLSQEYIDEFIKQGVVVIPGVLSETEIRETRTKFHEYLNSHGVRDCSLIESIINSAMFLISWKLATLCPLFPRPLAPEEYWIYFMRNGN